MQESKSSMSQTPGSACEIPVGDTMTNIAVAANIAAGEAIRLTQVLVGFDVFIVVLGIATPPSAGRPRPNAPRAPVNHLY